MQDHACLFLSLSFLPLRSVARLFSLCLAVVSFLPCYHYHPSPHVAMFVLFTGSAEAAP
jgi:hypothetical protein